MNKIALIASLSGSVLALSTAASFAEYKLNILHINDWHSRIESNNKFESTCSAEDEGKGECIGGAARLVTAINMRRDALKDQNVVLLNAGDNFQGSLFYTTYKGEVEAEFMNLMKFDAMTVGNHEFDDGEEALVPFLDKIGFPVLSANVSASAASKVGDRIKPSLVLDIGGQKVGIVGAVANDTPELASPGPNITFSEDVATITAEVKKLEAEGVNKIIALTHVGYPRDMEAIAKIPGVDVVVGGHSHTLLHNSDDKAAGPYPTMVDNPGGYKVPVTQAASYSKYLGEFVVTFDDAGMVTAASGDPLLLDKAITPDAQVLARIAELGAPIEELKGKEVSETTEAIDGDRNSCRVKECTMGNLIADAILDRVKDQGVTIAIQNGGGIRASIDQGVITMGEVLTVLPFQNTLATFQLTGKDLKSSIEAGLSEIEEGKGKFPQVAGMTYSFDKSVAPNEGRLKSIEVMEGGAYAPLDEAKTYTIATNNFVRGGGDGYKLFADNATEAYDFGPSLEQVVADYLTANRPYTPKLDGRITEVAAAEPAAAPMAEPAPAAPAPAAPAAEAPAAPAPATETAAAPATPMAEPAPAAPAPAAEAPAPAAEAPAPAAPAPAPATETAAAPATPMAEPAPAAPAPAAPAAEAPAPAAPATETAAAPATPMAEPAPAAPAPATPAAEAPAPAAPATETAAAPATPMAEPAAATPPASQKHTVVQGDTLWDLAGKFYSDPTKWPMIAEANSGMSANILSVGAELTIPPAN